MDCLPYTRPVDDAKQCKPPTCLATEVTTKDGQCDKCPPYESNSGDNTCAQTKCDNPN